jgi:hypothetical protein
MASENLEEAQQLLNNMMDKVQQSIRKNYLLDYKLQHL